MFAIAFDMTVADMVRHHPKGVPQAYRDIAKALGPFGFEDPRECLPDEE
jgi:virulence-associated protein VapD